MGTQTTNTRPIRRTSTTEHEIAFAQWLAGLAEASPRKALTWAFECDVRRIGFVINVGGCKYAVTVKKV
jgi:hypothetical protein